MKGILRVKRADKEWILEQVEKGNLFTQTMSGEYVPCGEYRRNSTSYNAMPLQHIIREINFGNIYFKVIRK